MAKDVLRTDTLFTPAPPSRDQSSSSSNSLVCEAQTKLSTTTMICTAKLHLYSYKVCWAKTIVQKLITLFIHLHSNHVMKKRRIYFIIVVSSIHNNVGCQYIRVGNLIIAHIGVGFKMSVLGFPLKGEIEM